MIIANIFCKHKDIHMGKEKPNIWEKSQMWKGSRPLEIYSNHYPCSNFESESWNTKPLKLNAIYYIKLVGENLQTVRNLNCQKWPRNDVQLNQTNTQAVIDYWRDMANILK